MPYLTAALVAVDVAIAIALLALALRSPAGARTGSLRLVGDAASSAARPALPGARCALSHGPAVDTTEAADLVLLLAELQRGLARTQAIVQGVIDRQEARRSSAPTVGMSPTDATEERRAIVGAAVVQAARELDAEGAPPPTTRPEGHHHVLDGETSGPVDTDPTADTVRRPAPAKSRGLRSMSWPISAASTTSGALCGEQEQTAWGPGPVCTETQGHQDDHVAVDERGNEVSRWAQKEHTA